MNCLVVTNTDRMILLFFVPHIKLLQQLGYNITIATSIKDSVKLQKKLPEVTIQPIPFTRNLNPLKNLKAYFSIKSLLKKEDFDFIHVHTPIAAFLVRMAAKKQKVIYTAHGFHFHEFGSPISNFLYYWAEKWMARKTTKLIVINEEDRKKALTFLPAEKIYSLHGVGIDASTFNPDNYTPKQKLQLRKKLGLSRDTKVLTLLAEFNNNKRQIDIVMAAEKLKNKYEDFVILLLGDGPQLELIQNEIHNRKLNDFVRCLGYRNDIKEILSITDIGLLLSIREGLPKSVMEMMAMKIPVVVSNIRGNRDLVKNGENGYVVPIKNPEEIMKSCLKLIRDESLRKEMGENSRMKIMEKYELNVILSELQRVYESIVP